jgi:hypothetical protein
VGKGLAGKGVEEALQIVEAANFSIVVWCLPFEESVRVQVRLTGYRDIAVFAWGGIGVVQV